MRYDLKIMKHKIRLIFDYTRNKKGMNFTVLDTDTLNLRVFLKDGREFHNEDIELITFSVKNDILDKNRG